MTKVTINPGVCGLITSIEASFEDQMEVTVKVDSGCASIQKMFDDLGDTFDAYEVCLGKPGTGPLYEYASEHLAGMIKCMEVECKLALPKEAWIRFE